MKKSVVIIGSGHAGVQAAASLRDEGYDGSVILIGEEPGLPYHKPPLSKGFMKGDLAQPQLLRGEKSYSDNRVEYRPGQRATGIDIRTRSVEFEADKAIVFDNLILATGSRARPLIAPGAELNGVFSLRSLADASVLREKCAKCCDVVIIGGGFIGLELSATFATESRKVTVVEAGPRLLGRAVSSTVAEHVQSRLEARGIRILTGTSVARLDGTDGNVEAIVTTDGQRICAQLVVVGIGALPNVELAREAGISVGIGVEVDSLMRTSVGNALAIGDVASYKHWLTGEYLRLESVQNATDQARLAARTVQGTSDAYSAVPWFWSDIGDTKLQIVGLTGKNDHVVRLDKPDHRGFSLFYFLDGKLTAIETVNAPGDHMLGRKLFGAGYSPSREVVAAGTEGLNKALSLHLALRT